MHINWAKWLLGRLPFALRVNRTYVFCLLFTYPVRRLHASFVEWHKKMRNKTGATPQVCMLRKVIFDELGINIDIEEGSGKPHDFIVKTSLINTDKERQMLALVDRYKMAGKSYLYINEEVSFQMSWSDHICEQCEFSSKWDWARYVCEQRSKTEIYITVRLRYSSGDPSGYLIAEVQASQILPRIIRMTFYAHFNGGSFTGTLKTGTMGKQTFTSPAGFDLRTFELDIYEDYNYKYIIKTV